MYLERSDETKRGEFPIVFDVYIVGEKEFTDQDSEEVFSVLLNELIDVDEESRYEEAIKEEEWNGVIEGLRKHCQVSGCFGCVGGVKTEECAQAIDKEVLEPFNKPLRGRFTRKVEWGIQAVGRGHMQLRLFPREGYAVWLEKDKEKLRKQETAAGRAKSMAKGAQFVGKMAMNVARKSVKQRMSAVRNRFSKHKPSMAEESVASASTHKPSMAEESIASEPEDGESESLAPYERKSLGNIEEEQ